MSSGRAETRRPVPPGGTWLPERLGPYRILQVLGEGGMGTVYLAEQTEPIRRRVALKVIRPGAVRRETLRRFEAERQALARMNHPNIAQAYEAGSVDGQPYFAMEYVPGLAITRYCDRERLTAGERLELFLAVCDGVHHLHQKGILHRDVKPSNVLVTEVRVTEDRNRPVPKLIDFGIAKGLDQPLTDGTVFTGERLIGTPSYLSPEAIQVSEGGLDVDTRSDVYALGVLLFELLTGELPFTTRQGNFLEVVRRITEEEAPLASARLAALDAEARFERSSARRLEPPALVRRLRGDLDWILGQAMARERSRRYGSAAELAADVRRHLRHEPVAAAAPSAGYRLRKFVRRNRSGVVSAALISLALLGAVTARTLEAGRANRAAVRANAAAARASREAAAAQRVSEFLVGLFEVSDPDRAAAGETTAREILDRGAQQLMGRALRDQPLVRARLMATIGAVYSRLGFYEPAGRLLEPALEIRRAHLGEDHGDVASSLSGLGNLHLYQGGYGEAESYYRRSLAIHERIPGSDPLAIANSLNNLGVVQMTTGHLSEAEPLLRRALAIHEKSRGPVDGNVANALLNLAGVLRQLGKSAEAEAMWRRALTIYEQTLGPEHTRVAFSLMNLGMAAFDRGAYGESASYHRRALSILEQNVGPEHRNVARGLSNLAEACWKLGDYDEAEALFQRARRIWSEVGGPDYPDLAHALSGLANLYRDQGRYRDAEPLYRRALAIREKALAPEHPDLLRNLEDLAEFLRATGRDREAGELEARLVAAARARREDSR